MLVGAKKIKEIQRILSHDWIQAKNLDVSYSKIISPDFKHTDFGH